MLATLDIEKLGTIDRRILEQLQLNRGCKMASIVDATGLKEGQVRYRLLCLEAYDIVRAERERGSTLYYLKKNVA